MSNDDAEDNEPVLIGEPVEAKDMAAQLIITAQDIDDALLYWDTVASDLFVGILEG